LRKNYQVSEKYSEVIHGRISMSGSGQIKLAGIASGIAFDELVAKMVDAEKYQANKLEAWKKTWQDKVDTLKELSSRITALQKSNNVLKMSSSFITRLATSTNNSVADITVDSTSLVGAYKMEVAGAVRHRTGSTGVDDRTENLGFTTGDTLEFSDGDGRNITVTLHDSMNLNDLNDEINRELVNAGSAARADIVSNGSEYNQWRLVVTSARAGNDGAVRFSRDDTGLSFGKQSYDDRFEFIGSNDINDVLRPAGVYNGHTSKRINFTVETGGEVSSGNVRIRWEDPTDGRSGTAVVRGTGEVTLFQGLKLQVDDGILTRGQQFSWDVYAPDIQLGQDRGLAQSAQMTHSGLSSRNAIVTNPAGSFQYSYRGIESQVINVPENTTLEGLVRLINESPGNPGVRASIINDGMGTATSFHLVITGIDSGAANQIEIKQSTLTSMRPEQFEVTRQATNAMVKIDDFPPGADHWIQKSSNLITDIVEGASIRLKDIGVVNFNITNNEEDMADKIQAFVDEYNAILDFIDEITKVVLDEEGRANINSAGILTGNYAINILRSNLRKFIGGRAAGFNPEVDSHSLLSQVGLVSNHMTRRLDFDRDEFIRELNTNADSVIKLFSANREGHLDNNDFIYMSGTNDTKSGIYDFKVEYSDVNVISRVTYTDRATGITYSSEGNRDIRISADGKNFTVFGGGARGAAIMGVNVDGDHTFTMTVKDGKAKTFEEDLDKLFDSQTGITKVLERNYESIIRNIDKRIDRENMRLVQIRKRLEMRFANLEVNMSMWNGQMDRLQAQMGSLPRGV
jgi:flagellar hook-associated protein 2